MEAKIGRAMLEHPSTPAITAPTPVPPPSTRRPRVREVSSRFMSPVSSYSSSSSSSSASSAGDLHQWNSNSPRNHHHHQNQRSTSAQRTRRQLKLPDGDENRPSETGRSLDSPLHLQQVDGGKNPKQQNRSKPFKENGHRLDTPTAMLPPPSRSRLNQQRLLSASAATRLLRLSGISLSSSTDGEEDNDNNNREISKSNGSDLLPTIRNHPKLFNTPTASPLSRSLSSDDSSLFRDVRASLSLKNGSLPPMAPNSKIQADSKKQKKALGQQADIHSLKLLHNRYLQWRFANANAVVKTQSQKEQAEKMFYSLGLKMLELSDSVQKKRIEFQHLQRVKAVTEIVESQTPSLEQWAVLEEEFSTSVSETTEALLNASLRLPLDSKIKVETKELAEAMAVASKSMEGIMQNIGNLVPKTQEMETLMSELARVSSIEKASIEDCSVALLKTQSSHIEECYLRSQLIQQKKCDQQEECTTLPIQSKNEPCLA